MKLLITESQLDNLLGKINQTDDIPKLYDLLDYISDTSLDWDDIDSIQSEINDKDIKKEIHNEIEKRYNRDLNNYESQKNDVEKYLATLNLLIKNIDELKVDETVINRLGQQYEYEKNRLKNIQSTIANLGQYDEFYNENYKWILNDYGKAKIEEKIRDKINKVENLISVRIEQMFKELGVSNKSYDWGDSPIDDVMGQPFGDKRGMIFLKDSEYEYETEDGFNTIYDGVEVELVFIRPEYRNKGVAKELMTKLVNAADKYKVKLYIKTAPQEDDIKVEDLKRLYESFGFVFDGISGYRLPK